VCVCVLRRVVVCGSSVRDGVCACVCVWVCVGMWCSVCASVCDGVSQHGMHTHIQMIQQFCVCVCVCVYVCVCMRSQT